MCECEVVGVEEERIEVRLCHKDTLTIHNLVITMKAAGAGLADLVTNGPMCICISSF